jgi:hypothetical protein
MEYTVGKCKEMSYNVSISALETHINALGTIVQDNFLQGKEIDDNVSKCLDILEDALQQRIYEWK